MRRLVAAVPLLLALPLAAEELPCGSSEERIALVREAEVWSAARAGEVAAKGLATAPVEKRDGIFVVPADATNTPFRNPLDLAGRTLVFERTAADRYDMRNIALDWSEDLGTLLALQGGSDEPYAMVTLDFDFPFFERTTRTIYVSGNNSVHFSVPAASQLRQYGEVDLATYPAPLIAPLLTTRASRLASAAQVYVLKDSSHVSITWIAQSRYTVRATLIRTGEIRFSYPDLTTPPAASAVLLTSGSEAWRSNKSLLASASDPSSDLRVTVPAAMASMLDITNVSVTRVAGLDLYELRVTTAAPVNARAANETLQITATLNQQTFRYYAYADGRTRAVLPVWGGDFGSRAARVDGNDVVFTFLDDHLANPAAPSTIVARSYRLTTTNTDSTAALGVTFPAATGTVRTDFSGSDSKVFEGTPIAEAFSLAVLSVGRVWDQVKTAYPHLDDDGVDGVAIYQNFHTDLVTYAGAYSTGGNAGVAGLAQGDTDALRLPRSPALMHMNTVGYGHNRTDRGASRVVLHELGHRWLLFVSLMESGTRSYRLNPVSAHPAQYVDTRAAFKVYTDFDTSVMGGGFFTDNGATFTTGPYGPHGYSWLDLYLMGLASVDEVRPMFYVADSSPELGGEYYAPPDATFNGTRRDFTIQQVVEGTGPRTPAYPVTQRQFRVVFILLSDPAREVPPADVEAVNLYRTLLERDFATATNGRGSVTTGIEAPPIPGPRRRAVGR